MYSPRSLQFTRSPRPPSGRRGITPPTDSWMGLLPAFRDLETGETHLSVHADGSPATVHIVDGLPESWVMERRSDGRIQHVKDSVVAGFVRSGRFYTRAELASKGYDA